MESVLLAAVLAIAAGGAGMDIARRIIPNRLCIVLALVAAGLAFVTGGASGLGSAALHGAIALVAGMGLFAGGLIGGGDAKFYAAGALSLPLAKALPTLGWTVTAGLVLLIVMVAGRKLFVKSGNSFAELRKMELPYGVAIAAGLGITQLFY